MPSDQDTAPTTHRMTQEELQREFNYMQAERITKKLLERGLITEEEFEKIMAENKRTFPTILSPLL
jgi:mannitol/fructose-specific phosphotransferase system IIA component (Ntr-type)